MTSARRLFHESGTTGMCKICRRWNNWLRGKGWIMIFFKWGRIIIATFCNWFFFLFKKSTGWREGRQKNIPPVILVSCYIVNVQPSFFSFFKLLLKVKACLMAILDTKNRCRRTDSQDNEQAEWLNQPLEFRLLAYSTQSQFLLASLKHKTKWTIS